MTTASERLKLARKAKGWNQVQLAEKAGVATGTIGNIEAGTRGIKASALKLARALEVDANWLDTGEGTMEVQGSLARVESQQPSGAHTPADHLRALVGVFANAPDSTRDTVAMLAAGAIKNPATLPDCVRAIEALAAYSAAKGGPPTESKQFQPPVPTAVTPRHATEPHTHHPGT